MFLHTLSNGRLHRAPRKTYDGCERGDPVNVVIIGMGEVGRYVAQTLSTEGHEVVVVDHDLETLERIAERMDVATEVGRALEKRIVRIALGGG